jgi:hypothetical protein
MGIISFSTERWWIKANWVVRLVLADMLLAAPDDEHIRSVVNQAIGVNHLGLELIEEPTATQLKILLDQVIAATLQESEGLGLKWKEGLDENHQAQYKEALQELADLMKGR